MRRDNYGEEKEKYVVCIKKGESRRGSIEERKGARKGRERRSIEVEL